MDSPSPGVGDASRSPRVLLSGSSGLVGSILIADFRARGFRVTRLVRQPDGLYPGLPQRVWDPQAGEASPDLLAGAEVLVSLGGANLATGRWTKRRQQLLRSSRVGPTQRMAQLLARSTGRPRVWLCASGVGYYGLGVDRLCDEGQPAGRGFLAGLCRDWEKAAEPAAQAGVRVVHLRLGAVLSRRGGLLARLLPWFRLGLGGPLGDGKAWLPWVAEADVAAAVRHLVAATDVSGPVNLAAPDPVHQERFAQALGEALRRPAKLRVPAPLLRLLLGPMAEELILGGASVVPRRLAASGYAWTQPKLEGALKAVLASP